MNADEIDDLLDQFEDDEDFNESMAYSPNQSIQSMEFQNEMEMNDFNEGMEFNSDQSIQLMDVQNEMETNGSNETMEFNPDESIVQLLEVQTEKYTNERIRAKKSIPENWKRNSNQSLRMKGHQTGINIDVHFVYHK
ncbi:hypothetical protein ACI65C_006819 [Semiaphis heraclei]